MSLSDVLNGRRASTSALPDLDVEARFPCFATTRSEDARIEDAVLMLKVLW